VTQLGISMGWSHREPADRMVRLIRDAEDGGVSACWIVDSQLAMRDAFALLTLAAANTDRIHLGPGVTNLVTRHETVVANALVTLRSLAPGRVLAGIGAGDSAVHSIGLRPQRISRLEEGLHRLRALLEGSTRDDMTMEIAGNTGPAEPIFLAASQPRMLRLAGAVADGVILLGPADPAILAQQLGEVDRGAIDAGRDPGQVSRDVWVTMAVDGEVPGVEAVRSWASAQARLLTDWKQIPDSLRRFESEMKTAAETYDFSRHLSVSASHAQVLSDEFTSLLAVAGDVEHCAARLRGIAAVGADRITVSLMSGGRERRLEQLAEVWAAADLADTDTRQA
jgi:5,10-methylenetetrahydromethanopterin reductase